MANKISKLKSEDISITEEVLIEESAKIELECKYL